MSEPVACIVYTVLCDVQDYCAELCPVSSSDPADHSVRREEAYRNDRSWHEQRFRGMGKGLSEGFWIVVEPNADHRDIEDEQDDVEEEERAAECIQ